MTSHTASAQAVRSINSDSTLRDFYVLDKNDIWGRIYCTSLPSAIKFSAKAILTADLLWAKPPYDPLKVPKGLDALAYAARMYGTSIAPLSELNLSLVGSKKNRYSAEVAFGYYDATSGFYCGVPIELFTRIRPVITRPPAKELTCS
jgi:hypothetical protein